MKQARILPVSLLALVLILASCQPSNQEPSYRYRQLTWHFNEAEFACHHCGRPHVDPALVMALQQLRDRIGTAIVVNSGFRCPDHNQTIGGACHSYHMAGQAADIHAPGVDTIDLALAAQEIEAFREGGIGVHVARGYVHVDLRTLPARWGDW